LYVLTSIQGVRKKTERLELLKNIMLIYARVNTKKMFEYKVLYPNAYIMIINHF